MNALGLLRQVLAAAEPPVQRKTALICVFRGSGHKEHADAFSSDLKAAGIANKPEHGSIVNKYSEVHVHVKGATTTVLAALKTTLRLLSKHHGLFVRYRSTPTGLHDMECAPVDFERADFEFMLEHGDQNITAAAEPTTPGSFTAFFDLSLRHDHDEADKLLEQARRHVQVYGDELSSSDTTDTTRIALVGTKPAVSATLLALLTRLRDLRCVNGFRVDSIYPWIQSSDSQPQRLLKLILEHHHVHGAAEPQVAPHRHFDFYVWEQSTASGYPTEMIAEITRIIHESGAVVDKPSVGIKHASGVADARRVHVRIVTSKFAETVKALLSQLPKYKGFAAFCNDTDADDSYILPTDRLGIANLVRTLAEGWN